MSKHGKFRMGKLLNIVSSIKFIERTRHRFGDNKVSDDDSPNYVARKHSGIACSSSTDLKVDDKCPVCDLTNCRHEMTLDCLANDVTEIVSLESGALNLVGDLKSRGVQRSPSLKEETSRCSDEVELTDDQKAELKQAFSMFEKTGKGRIPARDLGELLRCLGWNPSEQDLEEARHELELTTRGTISFAEVEAYIARRGGIYYGNNAEEDIMVAFQVLDKNGSGRITVEDFRHFMTTMGERMSHEEAEELITRSRQDGKDYIEYRDLVHAIQHLPT